MIINISNWLYEYKGKKYWFDNYEEAVRFSHNVQYLEYNEIIEPNPIILKVTKEVII